MLRYFWPQVQWGHPSVQSGKKAPNEHPAYVGPPTTLTFQKQQKVLCWVFDLADILPMSCSFYQWVRYVKSGEHTRAIFLSHIRILNNHVHCACMCLSSHFLHACRNIEFVIMALRACLWPRSTLWRGSKCICWIFSSPRKHWGTRLLFAGCSRCRWAILLKWSPLPRFRLELASAAVTI